MLDFVLDSMKGEPFYTELKEIEHAAALSFDDLAGALYKLNKGYTESDSELHHIQSGEYPGDAALLSTFLQRVKDKIDDQKKQLADAKETFKRCANSFGEEAKNGKDLPRFFGLITGFIQSCKQHEKERLDAERKKDRNTAHSHLHSPLRPLHAVLPVNPLHPSLRRK